MEEEFYQFLVREGILFKFLEKINKPLKEYLEDLRPKNYLMHVTWGKDWDFWYCFDNKWDIIVEQKMGGNGKVQGL
jgi:hypothetical protein